MSNSSDNRWRASNSQNQPNRRSSHAQLPRNRNSSADATPTAAAASKASNANVAAPPQQQLPPNPWTGAAAAERSRSASAARGAPGAATLEATTAAAGAGTGAGARAAQEETYVPVGGFNAEEVKEFLSKSQKDAVAGDTEKTARWKAPSDGASVKQGGPWAQKSTMMTNGSDFWVLLKKQVIAKEQGAGG